MNFAQKIYNAIRDWQPPLWIKKILGQLNDLMIAVLKEAGKQYIDFLKTQILIAAQNKDWTSKEKFDYVFKQAKEGFIEFGITLKDNELNTLINYIVSQFKADKVI